MTCKSPHRPGKTTMVAAFPGLQGPKGSEHGHLKRGYIMTWLMLLICSKCLPSILSCWLYSIKKHVSKQTCSSSPALLCQISRGTMIKHMWVLSGTMGSGASPGEVTEVVCIAQEKLQFALHAMASRTLLIGPLFPR